MAKLEWPREIAAEAAHEAVFAHERSNLVLDFHGDPASARLAVFSDGNHHMALADALAAFARVRPEAGEPFYTTTPPRVVAELLERGALRVGNLRLSVKPHVFISPPTVCERLAGAGHVGAHHPLARSRGSVLLVAKGNPKGIRGIADLARPDLRIFLSHPVNEKVSFEAYFDTLKRVAARTRVALDFIGPGGALVRSGRLVFGELIHHREAPQAVANGAADCAVVFYHLGLRYTRVFPEAFELVQLGHQAEQVRSDTHIALVGDGGAHGSALLEFMLGPDAAAIYDRHGLDPQRGGAAQLNAPNDPPA
jgi:hypothetical protein